ncbi:MAG: dicarboxylate/amino acid:cation symporter [Planctomycetes bacterium]|nr:dicarboxylate/amino acid:cation symporter [Planctomycetota bacterium]
MMRLALHWQILITMIAGALVGVILNRSVSEHEFSIRAADFPDEDSRGELSENLRKLIGRYSEVSIKDTPNRIEIRLTKDGKTQTYIVDPSDEKADAGTIRVRTVKILAEDHAQAFRVFRVHGRSWARWIGDAAKAAGDLFLRMLKMVAIPLIITSLLTGVVGLGKAERLGKMFSRTLLYYLVTSLLAIVTGLAMVNLIRPGGDERVEQRPAAEAQDEEEERELSTILYEQLEAMIPDNPIGAAAGGKFLSIIAFTLAFGIFTILVGGRTAEVVGDLSQATFEVMMTMTMAIIRLAPAGVFCFILSVTAVQGLEIFASLGMYMLTVACALAFHALITLPLLLYFVARRNPLEYAGAMSPALLTAFGSASSNGTLPLTLTCVEKRAGVSNRVGSFVLPLGATINMDGTALYEVVAVLFIAQYSGIDLSVTQQIIVALTALLASIGAAGIPHAGLVMMVIILQAVGLPTESQGLIIAVDRVLDMARTSVNVWSDSCGCAVIARFENGGEGAGKGPTGEVDI